MFQLLNEIEDPTQADCDKYGIYSWSQYKTGMRLENPSPLQRLAQAYYFCVSMLSRTPRAIVLGRPLIEEYVKLGEPIPETFEEAEITYNLESPFYTTILL